MVPLFRLMGEPIMSRREQIEKLLRADPNDTFLNYTLALEWDKEGETGKSLELFARLMTHDPPYVPAFFMAGQLLTRMNREDEARQVLTEGIQHARQQGNEHAAAEMTEFLAGLVDL